MSFLKKIDSWLKMYERLGAWIATTILLVGGVGSAIAAVVLLWDSEVPAWVPVVVAIVAVVLIILALNLRRPAPSDASPRAEYEKRLIWDALQSLQQAIGSEEPWDPSDLVERGVLGPARGLLVREPEEDVRFAVLIPEDEPATRFYMRWAAGHRPESVRKYRADIDQTMAGLAFRRGEFIESPDVRQDERFQVNPRETRPFRALVALPLRINETIAGALSVVSTRADAFNPSDVAFIKIIGALIDVILAAEEDAIRLAGLREALEDEEPGG